MWISVRCSAVLAAAVAARVQQERAVEKAWWKARKAEMPDDLTPRRRSAWLAAAQAAYEVELSAGRLRGTASAVVVPALREELAERGWLAVKWRRVPAGYRSRKARPWGISAQGWEKRVPLKLPDELGEVVARGSYWTSAPHVAALQRWYKRHGGQHSGTRREGRVWRGAGPSDADLKKRDDLQAAIVTTHMVLRAAMCRALDIDPAGQVTRARRPPADEAEAAAGPE